MTNYAEKKEACTKINPAPTGTAPRPVAAQNWFGETAPTKIAAKIARI
jgi:hypothetical protein